MNVDASFNDEMKYLGVKGMRCDLPSRDSDGEDCCLLGQRSRQLSIRSAHAIRWSIRRPKILQHRGKSRRAEQPQLASRIASLSLHKGQPLTDGRYHIYCRASAAHSYKPLDELLDDCSGCTSSSYLRTKVLAFELCESAEECLHPTIASPRLQ